MINKLKRILGKLGYFKNSVVIYDSVFEGVKYSRTLQDFYFNKNNEIEMFILLKNLQFDSMIDVGAYFGYFSIYANKVNPEAKITAFEADIKNFEMLSHAIKINSAKVTPLNLAVGDKDGKAPFYKPIYKGASKYPAHSQLNNPNEDLTNLYKDKKYLKYNVTMNSLSNVLKKYAEGTTLLKLDIEGYEEKALISAQTLLKTENNLNIIVEIMINDENKNEIFNLLIDCGYSAYLITNAGLIAEERPLTMPKPHHDPKENKLRTIWKNHLFTKLSSKKIKEINLKAYSYNL